MKPQPANGFASGSGERRLRRLCKRPPPETRRFQRRALTFAVAKSYAKFSISCPKMCGRILGEIRPLAVCRFGFWARTHDPLDHADRMVSRAIDYVDSLGDAFRHPHLT